MGAVAITRVINACVLLEFSTGAVLTDPYFDSHWFMRFEEPIGLGVHDLPQLAAILGGHGVFDHWQPQSLRSYAHRATTAVFASTTRMARTAWRAGFADVAVLGWGERREPALGLTVWCVPGERVAGMRTNSYVISDGNATVFIGTEARNLGPIDDVAANHRIDIAILPVNGARMLGRRLVMDAATAVEAAGRLGARMLVPIHYSQRPLPLILRAEVGTFAVEEGNAGSNMRVAVLAPGVRTVLTTAQTGRTAVLSRTQAGSSGLQLPPNGGP